MCHAEISIQPCSTSAIRRTANGLLSLSDSGRHANVVGVIYAQSPFIVGTVSPELPSVEESRESDLWPCPHALRWY